MVIQKGVTLMRTVIAMGTGGGRLLESLVWAACAEALKEPALRVIWLEPDDSLDTMQELLLCYDRLRRAMPDRRWTAIAVETWSAADGSAAMMAEDPLMQALLDRQEAASHWRSRAEHHPNLAALALGAQIDAAGWLDSLEGDVLLCGDLSEPWCASGVVQIARRLKAEGRVVRGVMLLPVRAVSKAREAMAADALAIIRKESLLDVMYLTGMPQELRTDKPGAHLAHWLGALAVQAAFDQENRGTYAFGAQQERFGWADFGAQSDQVRVGYSALIQLAASAQAEFLPVLEERLGVKPRLGQRRIAWFNAHFRQAHLLPQAEADTLRKQLDALRLWSARLIRWVLEVVSSLPPQWQDRPAYEAAMAQMGAQYRQLLDTAGELSLMEEEIDRSGMASETLVQRGAHQETAADALLRKARRLREDLLRLEEEQAALAKIAGGAAKQAMIRRMQLGIDRALEAEGKRVENWRAAVLRDDMDTAKVQEGVYRLETHLRILQAQRARTEADLAAELASGSCMPPHLTGVRAWGNDLLDPAWLGMLAQYLITEDDKERRVQGAALLETAGLTDTLRELGRNPRASGGLLGGLLDEYLTTVREEVR